MAVSPGEFLKSVRVERGLTVGDVAKGTRMRELQVLDLERDNYSTFASIAYARNFLQLYAKFLNADIKEILDKMTVPSRIGVENYQYLLNQGSEEVSYRPTRRFSRQSMRGTGAGPGKLLIAAVIGIPVLIFIVVLIINLRRLQLGSPEETKGDAEAIASEVTPTPVPNLTPVPSATPTATPVSLWEDQLTPSPTPTTPVATPSGGRVIAPGVIVSTPAPSGARR